MAIVGLVDGFNHDSKSAKVVSLSDDFFLISSWNDRSLMTLYRMQKRTLQSGGKVL